MFSDMSPMFDEVGLSSYLAGTCVICGEIEPDAEMHDPQNEDDSFPVHAECGLQAKWEIS